jgi:hypothetical protein
VRRPVGFGAVKGRRSEWKTSYTNRRIGRISGHNAIGFNRFYANRSPWFSHRFETSHASFERESPDGVSFPVEQPLQPT